MGGVCPFECGAVYILFVRGRGGTAGTQGQDVENRPRMLLLNNNFPRQSLVVTGTWAAYSWRLFPFSSLSSDRAPKCLFGPGLAVVRLHARRSELLGFLPLPLGQPQAIQGSAWRFPSLFCAEKESDQLPHAILIMFKISLFGLIGLYLVA